MPSSSRAHVYQQPTEIAVTPVRGPVLPGLRTATGRDRWVLVPSPSWPSLFWPQQAAVPSSSRAQVWPTPPEIWVTAGPPATSGSPTVGDAAAGMAEPWAMGASKATSISDRAAEARRFTGRDTGGSPNRPRGQWPDLRHGIRTIPYRTTAWEGQLPRRSGPDDTPPFPATTPMPSWRLTTAVDDSGAGASEPSALAVGSTVGVGSGSGAAAGSAVGGSVGSGVGDGLASGVGAGEGSGQASAPGWATAPPPALPRAPRHLRPGGTSRGPGGGRRPSGPG